MKRRLTHGDASYHEEEPHATTASLLPPLNDVTARMISSSIGSIVTSLTVTPLDVAKVRLQNILPEQRNLMNGSKTMIPCPQGCGCGSVAPGVWKESARRNLSYVAHHHHPFEDIPTSTSAMLRKIYLEEGIAGLYRGIRPTLIMAVPNTMLYYTCYDELVQHVRDALPAKAQVYAPLVAGGTARWLASTATAPLEYMRTREASLSGSHHNFSLRQIVQTQGIRSLYRGLAPTLWRDVPFSAIYWVVIEELRLQWRFHGGGAPTNVSEQFGQSFVNGLIAGTISACCTTPFDVLKTRQQAATATAAQAGGTLRALQQVARTEGVAGLWRGNWARTAKVAPSCAIMISSYEVGKRLLLMESS